MKSISQFKVIDGFFRTFQTSESIKCFIINLDLSKNLNNFNLNITSRNKSLGAAKVRKTK